MHVAVFQPFIDALLETKATRLLHDPDKSVQKC